jgi:uncharacterized protein (DUF2252 family)
MMVTVKKRPPKSETEVSRAESSPIFHSCEERIATGKTLRESLPRSSHAGWKPSTKRRDPIDVLEESNLDRLPELVPIRYGRMLASPFTFLRGSAALMAHDLAVTPSTGLRVQACGDCHLLNFGLFATPERNLVFDINDFDETLPAPWEWDLKRLAVSFAIAGRDNGLSNAENRKVVLECARAYREHLHQYSRMSPLEVWYTRLDIETIIAMAPDEQTKKTRQRYAEKARERIVENLFPKIASRAGGRHRLVDQPPLLFHVAEPDFEERVRDGLADYRESLSDERRVLLDRYHLEDFALKVVGIGSVGTRCFIGLFFDEENHPLMLQFKEACRSVLEPHAGKSRYDNQGQRVVIGQRLMQSSSDIFLGWTRGRKGYDFFVRQLRDMKMSVPIEGASAVQFKRYAEVCGWTLARAHAKSGDAATISGYLGRGDRFDQALGEFCMDYADQTKKDHAALVKAVRSGRVQAIVEE